MSNPCPDMIDNDSPQKSVSVEELVRRCGGDFLDVACVSAPIIFPDLFVHHTPEEVRERTIDMFKVVGVLR